MKRPCKVYMGFRLERELRDDVKALSAERGQAMSKTIRELLQAGMKVR